MEWRKLFNFTTRPERSEIPGEARLVSAAADGSKGVFITPQAIVTFPVATFAIGLVWKVIGTMVPSLQGSLVLLFCLSLLTGIFIWWIAISDPKDKMTGRDKGIAFVVGIVNSFYLFASTAGIVSSVTPAGGG